MITNEIYARGAPPPRVAVMPLIDSRRARRACRYAAPRVDDARCAPRSSARAAARAITRALRYATMRAVFMMPR